MFKGSHCLLLLFMIVAGTVCPGQAHEELIPPDAHEKAVAALQKLGPDRGALSLKSKVLDIIGLSSTLKIDTAQMKKTLKELDARVTGSEIRIALSGDVLFDFDRWTVRDDALPILKKILNVITASKSQNIIIAGHTDSIGDGEYNRNLSMKRAGTVRDWLMKEGKLAAAAFKLEGHGETQPIAPNTMPDGSDNPEGRQRNRRVEIRIQTVQ